MSDLKVWLEQEIAYLREGVENANPEAQAEQLSAVLEHIEALEARIKELRAERKQAADAQFDAFMAGLGPSRWER